MSEFWTLLATGGYGVLSALVPIFNAELYVMAVASLARPEMAAGAVVAMTLGTVVGKIVIFEGARRGSARFTRGSVAENTAKATHAAKSAGPVRRWISRANAIMLGWLSDKRLGPLTTLAASLVGIPPLFIVSVLAGVARQNIVLFCSAVFVGRFIRFAIVAWPFIIAWN